MGGVEPEELAGKVESDSTYRRCPSAYSVSNASVDFPEPETPVMTTSLSRGDRDADIFEVVLAGTFDDDIFHS
jgi:hypothetical protein